MLTLCKVDSNPTEHVLHVVAPVVDEYVPEKQPKQAVLEEEVNALKVPIGQSAQPPLSTYLPGGHCKSFKASALVITIVKLETC
jgi:hypothetical protein